MAEKLTGYEHIYAQIPESKLVKSQTKTFRKDIGYNTVMYVEIRYDDECGNKHNSFAITGHITVSGRTEKCGCIHEDIKKHFPELAKYIKWHLCGSDMPMYYVANTTFLAGNRDCWGKAPDEPNSFKHGIRFNDSQVTHFIESDKFAKYLTEKINSGEKNFVVREIRHKKDEYDPHYTIGDYGKEWHEAPFRSKTTADEFCYGLNNESVEMVCKAVGFSKGKERDLKAARSCAIWEEATDEVLSLPKEELTKILMERLPALMMEFKATVEELGFTY